MMTLEKFEEASEKVKEVILPTNLIYSEYFSGQTGNKVYLKPENMQYTGAYKVRGAYYKISTLTDEERKYAKAFYCQGGIAYEKMKLPFKLAMKAFASMVRKKKDATEQDKMMGEMLSHSYDISDRKFITPIATYVKN